MNKLRYTMFVVTVLLALALSAIITIPALADDTVPPPTETPTVEVPPTEEVAPVLEAELISEATSPNQAVAEIVASVPEGTNIVVINSDGEILPLASTEATDIIESNDPIWCPTGVAPNPGVGGCTLTQDSFNGGLIPLIDNKTTSGTIWILGSYTGTVGLEGGRVLIDGNSLGQTHNYSLTIKGGWTGSGGIIDTNSPSVFNVPLHILNWYGDIAVSDIVITGTSGSGAVFPLYITTTKNITLIRVKSNGNLSGNGAIIDNTVVNGQTGTGNITVTSSEFQNNYYGGLIIDSKGTISLKDVIASGNQGSGADLDNSTAFTPKNVVLSGTNTFNDNKYTGLHIISYGAITTNNLTANGNNFGSDGSGAYPYGAAVTLINYTSPVALNGTNIFNGNYNDGLNILSYGAITTNNITANGNGLKGNTPNYSWVGVYLDNSYASSAKNITLNGINQFNNNYNGGLAAFSDGVILASNLTANSNGSSGAVLDNTSASGSMAVTLTGSGEFNNNGIDGLRIYSSGMITVPNSTAIQNGRNGLYLDNTSGGSSNIVITDAISVGNNGYGLLAYSNGTITIKNLSANNNVQGGAWLDNSDSSASKTVTLTGTNNFKFNGSDGLVIFSKGAITLGNVTAIYNTNGYGVYLDNCLYDATPDDCTGLPGKAVTMNGSNNISSNGGNGLYISSLGAIKVNNLTASYNGGAGAILDNNWTAAVGGVTITGFANTSLNDIRGMAIYSRGAVLTSNLTANANGPISAASGETFYDGVFINNATTPGKFMSVTLLGVNQFNDNWNTGLQISSYGIVILNNLTANNNGEPSDGINNPAPEGNGVQVINKDASSAKAVTLNGTNIFNGNLFNGLYIQSIGVVVVNKATANNNGFNGAYIDNQFGVVNSAFTLLGYGTFSSNGSTGLEVYSNGNVTLNNITANYSTGGGGAIIVNNSNTITPVTVSLLGVNSFNGNAGDDGLQVYSAGAIILNNVTANDNSGNGAYLNNILYQIPLKSASITLNGTNTFVNNYYSGLNFEATGNVVLARITADLNDGFSNAYVGSGVVGTTAGTITLTCGSMNMNEGSGYDLTAGIGKLITLKGVFTYGNGLINVSSSPTVSTRTCPLP